MKNNEVTRLPFPQKWHAHHVMKNLLQQRMKDS